MLLSLKKRDRQFSEKEMTTSFLKSMSSRKGLPGMGTFWKIFQEVPCLRGRPDIIGLKKRTRRPIRQKITPLGLCDATILALLHHNAPHTIDHLVAHAGFSKKSVKKSLSQLIGEDHIIKTQTGSYLSNPRHCFDELEAWAFELKIKDIKRAIFQAQQYCLFAQCVFIVMPPNYRERILRFEPILDSWGIGAAIFDPFKRCFEIIKDAKDTAPLSKQHEIYAISCAINTA